MNSSNGGKAAQSEDCAHANDLARLRWSATVRMHGLNRADGKYSDTGKRARGGYTRDHLVSRRGRRGDMSRRERAEADALNSAEKSGSSCLRRSDADRRGRVVREAVLAAPDLARASDAADGRDTLEGGAVDATLRCACAALLNVRLRAGIRGQNIWPRG